MVAFFTAELLEGGALPFWFHTSLSPDTVLYAGLLTIAGAAIAGVVPALKVTRGLGAQLRQATAGGGGFRFGGIWTAVIICQIAVTTIGPITIFGVWAEARAIRAVDVGFPEQEYLALRVRMDRGSEANAVAVEERETAAGASGADASAQFRSTLEELERRLIAEPGVAGVTFADRLPRMYHPYRLVELDAGPAAPRDSSRAGYRVSSASVATNYFDVLGVPILAGRAFHAADLVSEAKTVIVNRSFVDRVLGGRNPIGRRLRYVGFEERDGAPSPEAQPWYEIIGVVRDLGFAYGSDPKIAGFYHPTAPGETPTVRMAVHVAGEPLSFAPRIRSVAAGVDPRLLLSGVNRLDEVTEADLSFFAFWFWFLIGVNAIALLLSLAGIYAVMAFTVSQRTREIGIRVALGADRRRIVATIFRRPATQVALGVLAGSALVAAAIVADADTLSFEDVAVLVVYIMLMMSVCMLAAIVPTRRALSVEPGEALRWE